MSIDFYNNELFLVGGKVASGKMFETLKLIEQHKSNGLSCAILSFADPIKQIVYDIFGMSKIEPDNFKLKFVSLEDIKISLSNFFKDQLNILSAFDTIKDNLLQKSIIYRNLNGDKFDNFNMLIGRYSVILDAYYQSVDKDSYQFVWRRMMQLIGTEIGQMIYKEIWTDLVSTKINSFKQLNIKKIFIDDLRFLHELTRIYELQKNNKIIPVIVDAPIEIRAYRRGVSKRDMQTIDGHLSEKEIDIVENYLKENLIEYKKINSGVNDG